MYLKDKKMPLFRLFCFFLFGCGVIITQSQAADDEISGSSSFGEMPNFPIKNQIQFEDQFNEYLFTEQKYQVQNLVQEMIANIEGIGTQKKSEDRLQKAKVQAIYHKTDIALLVLDYVLACRTCINSMIEEIERKMERQTIPHLAKYDAFLKQAKTNLGAMLRARYPYVCEKYVVQTSICFDRWGTVSLPKPDYSANFVMVNWLREQAKKSEIAQGVFDVYGKVLKTLEFITLPEDVLIFNERGRDINYYRNRLSEIFGQDTRPTPITVVVGLNGRVSEAKKETSNVKEEDDTSEQKSHEEDGDLLFQLSPSRDAAFPPTSLYSDEEVDESRNDVSKQSLSSFHLGQPSDTPRSSSVPNSTPPIPIPLRNSSSRIPTEFNFARGKVKELPGKTVSYLNEEP